MSASDGSSSCSMYSCDKKTERENIDRDQVVLMQCKWHVSRALGLNTDNDVRRLIT